MPRKVATPNCQRSFYQESVTYMEAVQKEAEHLASGKVTDMEYYRYLRQGNSGVLACSALFELTFIGD